MHDSIKTKLNPTKNDLNDVVRSKVVAMLNLSLADLSDLASQLKQAHWNIKGKNFIALHELFDQVHGEVAGFVDEVAERAVALGGVVEGTVRVSAQRSSLSEYPLNARSAEDHVAAVSVALSTALKHLRANIKEADEIGDMGTSDLYTEIVRALDKSLWFVEAHSQF